MRANVPFGALRLARTAVRQRPQGAILMIPLVLLAFAGCGNGATGTTTSSATTATVPKQLTPAELKAKAAQEAREKRAAAAQAKREAREAAAAERVAHAKEAHEAAAKKLEESLGKGLGATKATFESEHNMTAPSQPTPGDSYYRITSMSHGRVSGYEGTIEAEPPFSNRERLVLLAGINLPSGTPSVAEHSTCVVWRSPVLGHVLGTEYAEAATVSGSNSATMSAVAHPEC